MRSIHEIIRAADVEAAKDGVEMTRAGTRCMSTELLLRTEGENDG